MKKGVLKTRNKTLLITVFLSTLMIEFILVFLNGCSDGVGLAFDIDKQAFRCGARLCLWWRLIL